MLQSNPVSNAPWRCSLAVLSVLTQPSCAHGPPAAIGPDREEATPSRTGGEIAEKAVLDAPGWQTENWRMGAASQGRGFGTPEKWMPWVTTNHLYSITGLEQFDPELFAALSARPRGN